MVLDRRGFMKFAAGISAGIMATPLPWKLLDDVSIWTQSWPWIPSNVKGESTYVHAVSKTCPSGAALRVRLVGGRPVRVLPEENHPLGGGITALAAAEIQMMYNPARLTAPLKKGPDGGYTIISWDEAYALLQEKLAAAGSNVAFVSGDENGTTVEVLSALAQAVGSDTMFLMPSEGQCAAKAADLMNIEAQLGYDFENSDYVLAIGANILESWGTVVRNRKVFRDSHPHPTAEGSSASATFAYAGSVQNHTAALAKPWLPIYPGTEGILALGIANLLIDKGRVANARDFGAFKSMVSEYTPQKVAELTGVAPAKLEEVVTALLAAKNPVVVVGSEFSQGSGAAPVMAGFAVNALLGNINQPGGVTLIDEAKTALRGARTRREIYKKDLAGWLNAAAKPAVAVFHEANPVYALPNPDAVKKAVQAIPFSVAFSSFMDETTAQCSLILPVAMGLERMDDIANPYGCGKGIYCLTKPVAEPVRNLQGAADVLFKVAGAMKIDLGAKSFKDVLVRKASVMQGNFDILSKGSPVVSSNTVSLYSFALRPDVLSKALTRGGTKGKLALAPFAKLNIGTATTGIPPYNTKTLRANELDGKDMYVMMNGATAQKNGLANGLAVVLDSGKRKIAAKLRVCEFVMNDTVAVCLGYGHTAFDEFSRNKGANVMELLTATAEPETGLTVWSQASVAVSKA